MIGSTDPWNFPTNLAGLVLRPRTLVITAIPLVAFALGWILSRLTRSSAPAQSRSDGEPVIPSYRMARAAFARELDRVRRYDRALAILVFTLEDLCTPEASLGLLPTNGGAPAEDLEATRRIAHQVNFWNVGYALRDLLRQSDVAACDVPNWRYVVLLPEAGREPANLAAKRIEQRILETVGVPVRRGTALYRSDGLTIDDLVSAATVSCGRTAAFPPASRCVTHARRQSSRLSEPKS